MANAYRDAIFISLHVSSTGQAGTARTYYYQFSSPVAKTTDSANGTSAALPNAPRTGLTVWEEAQRPYLDSSQRLAGALQAALAQRFAGSPATAARFAVRELRSVAAPAIGVEVSSVSVGDPNILLATGASLAGTIERSVQALRPVGSLPAGNSGTAGAK